MTNPAPETHTGERKSLWQHVKTGAVVLAAITIIVSVNWFFETQYRPEPLDEEKRIEIREKIDKLELRAI